MKKFAMFAAVLLAVLFFSVTGYAEPEGGVEGVDKGEGEAPQEAEVEKPKAEEAVCGAGKTPEETIKNFVAAYKKADTKTVVSCMSDNLVEMRSGSKAMVGMMDDAQCKEMFGKSREELMNMTAREFVVFMMDKEIQKQKASGELDKVSAEIIDVSIEGDHATVKVKDHEDKEKEIQLLKVEDLWFLDSMV